MKIESNQAYENLRFERASTSVLHVENVLFERCLFSHTSFKEATLQQCRFLDCSFKGGDFAMTALDGSRFSGVQFQDLRFLAVDWTKASWGAGLEAPLLFERCELKHATFIGMDLEAWRFLDCELRDVDFRRAVLRRTIFSDTNLCGSLFQETDLREADLSTARNYTIAACDNLLAGARFSLPEAMALLDQLGIDLVMQGV